MVWVSIEIQGAGGTKPSPARASMRAPDVLRPSAACDWSTRSAPIRLRASPVSVVRTFWTTLRSAMMAATPMPTHRKKKPSRDQDDRISRQSMRRTNVIAASCGATIRRSTSRPSRSTMVSFVRAASSGSCVTSTSVQPRALVHVHEQVDDLVAGHAVEIARGLIGQQNRGIVRERARDRDALLLAARQLRRIVVGRGPPDRRRRGASRRARLGAPRTPAISIGTSTFSSAVSDGSRWKN